MKKRQNWHLVHIGIIYLSMLCFGFGMSMNIMQEFNLDLSFFIPHIIFMIIGTAFYFAPLLTFHLYFSEVSLILYSWILSLKLKLTLSEFPHQHLNECRALQFALELFNDAITKIIFWFFMMIMIFAISEVYMIVSFFITTQKFTLAIILVIVGYGSYGLLFIFLAHTYCTFVNHLSTL